MSEDDINLEDATLFCDGASGRYIPQRFAKEVNRKFVTGVSDDDYKVLEAGPDHEHYWDAWADVLDNASVQDPKLGECYLYQDGDLWVVPVPVEKAEPDGRIVLGYVFVPMTKDDWDGYAGAAEGSLICNGLDFDLILAPDGTISQIGYNVLTNQSWQIDWKPTKIL